MAGGRGTIETAVFGGRVGCGVVVVGCTEGALKSWWVQRSEGLGRSRRKEGPLGAERRGTREWAEFGKWA